MRTSCTAQGTLLSAQGWPKWELKKKKKQEYMYTYIWFTFVNSRNEHNSLKQLSSNKNEKKNILITVSFICTGQSLLEQL